MPLVEDAKLNKISVLLSDLDVGDRIVKGRLELFSTAEKTTSDEMLAAAISNEIKHSPELLKRSPLGPLQRQDARELLVSLLSTMNQCFPDYDFSNLSPHSFLKKDLDGASTHINYHLSFLVERVVPGFLNDLWAAIRTNVRLDKAEIYSLKQDVESDPFSDERSLSSFEYFFCDKAHQKILFFSCMTSAKSCPSDSDDEIESEPGSFDSEVMDGFEEETESDDMQ